ncbi:hypothetical protein PAECIP111891_07020 [Paenibacillus allorhizoplanae]|uniref:Uncharacterized protein n=1 Tax=Paenibacillus allorhizoplanae TaxID=2905648 RepID=A0ABN8H6G8_9BACL|nr:hypothetical protein [Paenibacillus allorhizoplanae]CAH1232477.1 hypothetical protein PAECIP111891_07020 [Paenibacillus allorhizoplanae]
MPKPDIILKPILDNGQIKSEIFKGYVQSIEDVYHLYAVYIGTHEVAVCNVAKKENRFVLVDFIGSKSCVKLIEEKLSKMID